MSKLTQQQKTEQSLSLTPAQIQAIKMLELTGLELEARIEHELEENPALEENYDEASTSEDSPKEHEDGSERPRLGAGGVCQRGRHPRLQAPGATGASVLP